MTDYSTFSDEQLSLLLQKDDYSAFSEIYTRYKGPLYIHAFHRLKDREECKDLIQQLFATLWDNRKTIIFKSYLSGYLYASVRNKVFNVIAHKRVASSYLDSIGQFANSGEYITDQTVRERELSQIIEKEINALPLKMREVFELSRKANLSHKQIAEELNISEKTVRNQVHNAIKILRVKLGILVYVVFIFYR
ncbi:RNA polymerase sigma factor [Mucilaginibacter boryungensis]|uniref:RNA polymerase sigma-70 factor n=1 Tax=Mucilaginibacter boryungensis TaxID=768480 RepID=A0ABR9XEC1_9SPHI|nr:RNA polymerase sigma-70 factor [Mucilaginibacter boryungensis]MBE9665398.1 RNA polymerase sigma-70 factor [Mucilaginibacter boryungensis]